MTTATASPAAGRLSTPTIFAFASAGIPGAMLMLIQPLRRLTDVVGPVTRGLAAL